VMDHLKTGIGLRGYGQKDPRVEYEKESFEIFESLKNNIADEAIKGVFRVVIEQGPPPQELTPYPTGGPQFEPIPSGQLVPQPVSSSGNVSTQGLEQILGPAPGAGRRVQQLHTNKDEEEPAKPIQRDQPKVGRNELCPCGSGKKFKRCHGTAA
jgi:preprotein translocase subunit SecA